MISLIFFAKAYAADPVGFITDIKGKVKKINGKEKEIELEKIKNTQYMIQQSKLAEIGEIFSSIAHQWKAPLVEITSLAQDMFFSGIRAILAMIASTSLALIDNNRFDGGNNRCFAPASSITSMALSGKQRSVI